MWPWPWSYRSGSCARHIVSFLPCHYKIHQGTAKLWTVHEKRPYFWSLISRCDLDLEVTDLVLRATYRLIIVNISAKSFQNPSRNGKIMDRTRKKDAIFDLWPLSVTLALELQTLVLRATHGLIKLNISAKSLQYLLRNGKVMDRTRKKTIFLTFDV